MSAPVIVLTGSPGVGKSTIASLLADTYERSALVTGDYFFDFLRNGKVPPWEPDSHAQNAAVVGIAIVAARSYASHGWTTIVEGIFGPWFLPAIRSGAAGAPVHYVVLRAPLENCLERFSAREPGAPADVVRKMHHEFDRATFDARHAVNAEDDASDVVAAVMALVDSGAALL